MSQLVVPAALESLSAVSEFVKEVAAAAGLDRQATYGLRLAVIELVTNTITHGYIEANLSGTIDLQANRDDQALTLVLEDTAIPYDPSQTAPPDDLNRPADERQIGGLGVYLALQQVDAYRYERVGNRNRSVIRMNRPGGGKRG